MKLVLASNNAKKLAELQALFDGLGIELVRQGELGVAEAEEPHVTFIENALAKARHASAATGLPAIADDSGLCVDAPSVAAARDAHTAAGRPAFCNTPKKKKYTDCVGFLEVHIRLEV